MKFVLSNTKETYLDTLNEEVKIRVYLPEGKSEEYEVMTDVENYTGCDYASAVLADSEEKLQLFLSTLADSPSNYEDFCENYEAGSVDVLEANGVFLINFDWDHCDSQFESFLADNYVLLGASGCDDGSLLDILPAAQWMKAEGKGLADFLVEFEEWEDDLEIYSNAADFIQRICDYQPNYYDGNLLADLTVALNKTYEFFEDILEVEEA